MGRSVFFPINYKRGEKKKKKNLEEVNLWCNNVFVYMNVRKEGERIEQREGFPICSWKIFPLDPLPLLASLKSYEDCKSIICFV